MKVLLNELTSFFTSIWNGISTETASTIIAGVVVFVLCEWAKEVWLTPLQEYKKLKSKVAYTLVMNAQYYANPLMTTARNEAYNNASNEMRALASELAAYAECIPLIHFGIPAAKSIREASKNMIGLSNSFYISSNELISHHLDTIQNYRATIKNALHLRN